MTDTGDFDISDRSLTNQLRLQTHSWTKKPTTLPFVANVISATLDVFRNQEKEVEKDDLKTVLVGIGTSILQKLGLLKKDVPRDLVIPELPDHAIIKTYQTDEGDIVGTETAIPYYNSNTSYALRARAETNNWADVRDGDIHDFSRLTNAWVDRLETAEGELQAQSVRMGTISDFRNGFYSLKWLNDLKQEPDERKIIEKMRYIKSFEKKGLTPNQQAAVDIEYDRLKELLDTLKNDYPKGFNPLLAEMIGDRKKVLGEQMDQYLAIQLAHNPPEEGQEYHLHHLCLLNLNKAKFDKSGVMINEQVMFEDMFEIFKVYDGMPLPNGSTLRTHILNCSVQGKKDTSLQREMNKVHIDAFGLDDETAIALTEETPKGWTEWALSGVLKTLGLKKATALHTTGYTAAIDTLDQLMDQKKISSVSCASGKDRTGAALGLALERQLHETSEGKALEGDFKDDFFGPSSIAAHVVELNTPNIRILKSVPTDELATEAGLGPVKRVAYLGSQLLVNLKATV